MKLQIVEISLSFDELVSFLSDINYSSEIFKLKRSVTGPTPSKEEIERELGVTVSTSVACFEDVLAADLIRGNDIIVVDAESEETHMLNLEKIKAGLSKMARESHPGFCYILLGEYDYLDYESLMQYALYGEEVYG